MSLLTARHEAAHAVADCRLGFTSTGASIKATRELLGHATYYDGWDNESGARRFLITLYAGYCSELESGGEPQAARDGASGDFDCAAEVLGHLEGVSEQDALSEAFAFVREPKNWEAIQTVAAELLVWEQLDGDEIAMLVDIVDGVSDRQTLDEYRAMIRKEGRK